MSLSSPMAVDHELDITEEVCPMTFVRAKLMLEKMAAGQVLIIRLREGEPRHNVPRAVTDHGHEVLSLEAEPGGIYRLMVRCNNQKIRT
jgi:tRNA 2-thiouridine synthesizing protein A